MKLIIESGATKTDWCAVEGREVIRKVRTSGMNFSTMSADALAAVMDEALHALEGLQPDEVHLYAAGMVEGSDAHGHAREALTAAFDGAAVECASDLLAAARAVCGRSAGIAAILGTGSNSCLYDGTSIVANNRSGGFILGDEGGGACLGKLFLADYIKGLVPEPLASQFGSEFEADYMTVVANVYRGAAPSAYLGGFAPWILGHLDDSEYVRGLVVRNLEDFFDRSLRYGRTDLPAGFVGGFAAACAPLISEIAASRGISISRILASPMEGLVQYHSL